jgi:hypothetical protein
LIPPGPRKPVDPAALDMGVMLAYGAAMMQVQVFERNLAVLVLALESKPWRTRTFKSQEHLREYISKLITRSVNTFHKASARQLRNQLPKGFDPELFAEIEPLIAWRDRLAHRYLIEHMRLGAGSGPRLKPEAFGELLELSSSFQVTALKLNERMLARLADFPKSDAPEGVRDVFLGLARAMMLGEEFSAPGSEEN